MRDTKGRLHKNNTEIDHHALWIPAAWDCSDLWERQFKKHLLLIINDIHSSPVDGNDDIVLWQTRPSKLVCLVEPREQQRPFVASVVDNILLHLQRRDATSYKVAFWEGLLDLVSPVWYRLRRRKAVVWDAALKQWLKTVVQHVRAEVNVVLLCSNHCQVIVLYSTFHISALNSLSTR